MAEKNFMEQIKSPKEMSKITQAKLNDYVLEKQLQNRFTKIDLTGLSKQKEKENEMTTTVTISAPLKKQHRDTQFTEELIRDLSRNNCS